jgi:hypothetical protein
MTAPQTPGPDAPAEPLLTVGGIVTAATALVACAVAFGLNLIPDQRAAILGLIAAAAPAIVAVVGRSRVWSPSSVRRLFDRKPNV